MSGPALADVTQFKTPSGNIVCSAGVGEHGFEDIDCALTARTAPPSVPRPAKCTGDWGYSFSMKVKGAVEVGCGGPVAGGTSGLTIDVAQYGQKGGSGLIRCLSQTTGLTCRNADGHGFTLSRRRQLVF